MLGCWLLGCWLGSWFCCWVVAGFFSIVSLTCWALSRLFDLGWAVVAFCCWAVDKFRV